METRIRRTCLFVLLVVSLLWGSPPLLFTAADNPPSESPVLQAPSLVYPLARRYPMSSLFDHSSPSSDCDDRDGILTIYTGVTVRDDANQDCSGDAFVGDYVDGGNCVWMVTDCDANVKDLRWQNFEQPG